MDDFMPHIDRRAIFLESPFNDINGTHDAGTKAARLGEEDTHDVWSSPIPRPHALVEGAVGLSHDGSQATHIRG
jgi:hypothetical protein